MSQNACKIKELHDQFLLPDNIISNNEIIDLYQRNIELINEGLSERILFDYTLRIKSIYCFSLSELGHFKKAEEEILITLRFFDEIYVTEKQLFNNVYYEKLVWNLMKSQLNNKKYELAKDNLNLLLKYFPSNETYPTWIKALPKENRVWRIMQSIQTKMNNNYYRALKIITLVILIISIGSSFLFQIVGNGFGVTYHRVISSLNLFSIILLSFLTLTHIYRNKKK